MTDLIHHEPGVYFGLSDDAYYSDPALGSTDLKRLLVGPADYWCQSLYNPQREDDSTRYKDRGQGLHCHILFGEDQFNHRFARELVKKEHPDALVTIADLKGALTKIGMATTGKKEELIARLRGNSSLFDIWDEMVEAQEKTGKTILKVDDYNRILIASAMIKKNPSLATCFQDGVPEVSVFWEQDGVRFRVRMDYLRYASIVDLKSFSNMMERPIYNAINQSFWNGRHDIQASHYLNGRQVMRRHIREGRVFGDVDRDWLKAVADVDDFLFVFVYHTLSGAMVTRGKIIRPGGHVDGAAAADIARAADIWRQNHKFFGTDMWVDMTPLEEISAEDEPSWLRWHAPAQSGAAV